MFPAEIVMLALSLRLLQLETDFILLNFFLN